jgi:hypothetical protein
MPPNGPERRRAVRRTPHPDESLSRVRLRTGRELAVIDISSAGALIEGTTRLLPGTRTDVHVVTRHGRLLVRTRVIRSFIWRLERDVVCYRTALEFDAAVETDADPALNERSESKGPVLSGRSESNGPALSERSESKGYQVPAEIPKNDEAPGIRYPDAMVERGV